MAASHHGHTPAAWTAVTIILVGFCVSGVYTVMAEPIGFFAGLILALLGGVVGLVMRAMGLGLPATQARVPAAPTRSAAERQEPASVES